MRSSERQTPVSSYVPWAELLRHCFDEDVQACPNCPGRLVPIAVIRRHDVIERILRHLASPLGPTALGHPDTIAVDVTGEPMPGWAVGVDPEPRCTSGASVSEVLEHGAAARSEPPDPVERSPPSEWDRVAPPAPDD